MVYGVFNTNNILLPAHFSFIAFTPVEGHIMSQFVGMYYYILLNKSLARKNVNFKIPIHVD